MKIIQTFATDNFDDNVNFALNTQQLFFHYISAQSVRKVYGHDQEFILVTDTKGKELATYYGFPYTSISTALDDYPFSRPLKLCGYKAYSLSLYPDDDIIHLDNDVMIKKRLPDFTDTIVQSNEGNVLELSPTTNWYKTISPVIDYELPPVVVDRLNYVYNPGVIGFKANSVVRQEYIETHNVYLDKNTKLLKNLTQEEYNSIHTDGVQYINTVLEESILYNLCLDNEITPTEVLNHNIVGTPPVYNAETPNEGEFYTYMRDRNIKFHIELGYLHFFILKRNLGEKHKLATFLGNLSTDASTTYIPYVSDTLNPFLSKRYGLSANPSTEEINTVIKLIITE